MRARFLILVLAIGAQAHLHADEQPAEIPPPAMLFDRAQQTFKAQRHTEAVEQLSQFLLHYPTHKHASHALDTLGRINQATSFKHREALIHALRQMTEDGEERPRHKMAMNWIRANEAVLGWKFGSVPSNVQPTKEGGIKVALGNVAWSREHVPSYRLYRIPAHVIQALFTEGKIKNAYSFFHFDDIPRERWEAVSFRVEMFAPDQKNPRAAFYLQSGRHVALFETLRANLSDGGVFVLEQEIEGFREQTVFRAPKFGLFCKTIGASRFAYAADVWTEKPIENLEI